MLTKTDLIAIKHIVANEGKLIRTELRYEIKILKMELSNRIAELESRLANIEVDINTIQKDIKKIKKDLKFSVDFLDHDYLRLINRVEKIEKQINLSPVL